MIDSITGETAWINRKEPVSDIVSPRHVSGRHSVPGHDYLGVTGQQSLPQCGHWTLAPALLGKCRSGQISAFAADFTRWVWSRAFRVG